MASEDMASAAGTNVGTKVVKRCQVVKKMSNVKESKHLSRLWRRLTKKKK